MSSMAHNQTFEMFPLATTESTIPPASPPSFSVLQRLHQQVYTSVANSLAYPGRDEIDARAPYQLQRNLTCRYGHPGEGKLHICTRHRDQDRFHIQCYKIGFYRIAEDGIHQLPADSTYQRQAWSVGIAFNEFRFVDGARRSIQQVVSHWGVYITPQTSTRSNQVPMTRIFGMNFIRQRGSPLILEDAWGTPSGYKKLLTEAEFKKLNDRQLKETTMYFSLEEFVLEAQCILREFASRGKHKDGDIYSNPGSSYSLASANCQHFAALVMQRLKKPPFTKLGGSSVWTNKKRLEQPFVLSSLGRRILEDLKEEAETVEIDREILKDLLEMSIDPNKKLDDEALGRWFI